MFIVLTFLRILFKAHQTLYAHVYIEYEFCLQNEILLFSEGKNILILNPKVKGNSNKNYLPPYNPPSQ